MKNTIVTLSLLFIITSCAYNKSDEAIVPAGAKPTISYQQDIKPILILKCYTCHSDTATDPEKPGYAFFNNFDVFHQYATSASTANADFSKIIARLRYVESPGMPFNRPKLSEEEIVKIEIWIKEGALNN